MKDILVIDDVEIMREVLTDLLLDNGYIAQNCASASEALELLKSESFKMIVSDLHMPNMTGIEFCEELRKSNPMTYVLAMTGHPQVFEIVECRDAGFDDYITKPYTEKEILKRVGIGLYKIDGWLGLTQDNININY